MTDLERPTADWSRDEPWGQVADTDSAWCSSPATAIAAQMEAVAEPWPDAAVIDTGHDGTAAAISETAQEAVELIRPRGSEHVWRPARPCMLPD